jgi:hypothetical protein
MSDDHNGGRCRRVLPPMMALAAAGVALAGCGSGSTASQSGASGESSYHGARADFVVQVDKVCARAVAAHAGHAFPVPKFNPEHPDASQLPIVGDYLARYGGLPTTDAALHALDPPAADADAWRHLLDLVDLIAANAEHQITAARARDVTGFVHSVDRASKLATKINAAGTRFGFTPKSSCGQVFG